MDRSADGSVSKVVNEIVKNFSPKAFYRCYTTAQKSIPEGTLFIEDNTLFIGHNNTLVEYNGDPDALYYNVSNNMLFTVAGSSPSSSLKPYYEGITKIYEVKEIDIDNYIPLQGDYENGYYIFKKQEDNMAMLYYYDNTMEIPWEEIAPLKAYIVYDDTIYLYETQPNGYRDVYGVVLIGQKYQLKVILSILIFRIINNIVGMVLIW